MKSIKKIVRQNPTVEVIRVPRLNVVRGLTNKHIASWGWEVNGNGWVNFPDYQDRIFIRERDSIRWENKVHERLVGYATSDMLPASEEYCLIHVKDIERQILQNEFYRKMSK